MSFCSVFFPLIFCLSVLQYQLVFQQHYFSYHIMVLVLRGKLPTVYPHFLKPKL